MTNKEKLRERFLRDPLSRRLGGMAATFGRISSSARNSNDPRVVINLLDEAKHLIEWTAADVEPERGAELVRIQTMITIWQGAWRKPAKVQDNDYYFQYKRKIGLIKQWIFPA